MGPRDAGHLQVEVGAQDEGEAELVLGEQRAAHVLVQVVLEVVLQVAQASLQLLRLIATRGQRTHPTRRYIILHVCG